LRLVTHFLEIPSPGKSPASWVHAGLWVGPCGLTLALFGPALANPSTTGPTWANPSPIRASGPTRAIRNPSLLGSLGLRGLTLALLGSLELTLAEPTWGGLLGLRELATTTYAAVGNTECGVHLLYVCTFSITPALSHTTPSAYLIAAHDEHYTVATKTSCHFKRTPII